MLRRYREYAEETESLNHSRWHLGDPAALRPSFRSLHPHPGTPAASAPLPRSAGSRPRTCRVPHEAALSEPSERTSPCDQGKYSSLVCHLPCWVPRPQPARAQAMPLLPDPFWDEGRDKNRAERWQDGKQAPPRRQAGQGQLAADAGAEVTDGGDGGGRVRNWISPLPPSSLGQSLAIGHTPLAPP